MSWQQPQQPVLVPLDDEEAGGDVAWYEHLPPNHELPTVGDWVWGPEACDDMGQPVGHKTTCYEVVRRGWTFVQPGSPSGQQGHWWPMVRVHVRKLSTAAAKVDVVIEP